MIFGPKVIHKAFNNWNFPTFAEILKTDGESVTDIQYIK